MGQVQDILKRQSKKLDVLNNYKRIELRELVRDKLNLPYPFLSPSQIEMYIRCPLQYYKRYVLGEKRPPGVAIVEGGSHHPALAMNNQYKKKTGRDHKLKKVFERFADEFSTRSKEIEDWEGEKRNDIIKRGKLMLGNYLDRFAPRVVKPLHIEDRITVDVQNVPVMGVVDLMAEVRDIVKKSVMKKSVVDYKTWGKAKSEHELAGSPQLSCYLMMARSFYRIKGKIEVGFCGLNKNNGDIKWQAVAGTLGRVVWFRRVVLQVADAISRGAFPPTSPMNWCCDPKWCGYYKDCRGKYQG